MKLATVSAVFALACPMAVAQNFPEIPENHWATLTPRKIELIQRMLDFGMLDRGRFSLHSPRIVIDVDAECQNYLALASIQLGNIPGFHRRYGLEAWVWNLPLVEAFLSEVYASKESIPKDATANLKLIRERARLHYIEINDDAYTRFSDVPKGHWADEAIHRMRELGIVKGYPDNTYRG